MENLNLGVVSDAVSSMEVLRDALTAELDDVENQIYELVWSDFGQV